MVVGLMPRMLLLQWAAFLLALLSGPKIFLPPVEGADVPLFTLQAKLIAQDAGATYGFTPPAIYGRGFQTLITGYIDPDKNDYGLYVHSTDDGYAGAGYSVWTQQMKIRPKDGAAADHFGKWMSTTDYTLMVSSPMKSTYKGAAYIFNGTLKHWTQTQKIAAADAKSYDYFGEKTSIHGNRAIIGARGSLASSSEGKAYIFERFEAFGDWSQVAKLVAKDTAVDQYFGQNVAIYGDYALVSAKNDVEKGSHGGCAYIFQYKTVKNALVWTQMQKITNSDLYEYQSDRDVLHTGIRLGDKFFAEDLIIYKTSAAMSVFRTDQEELNQQSVYVYNITSKGTWSQSQILFYNGTTDSGGEFHSSTRLHLRDENLVVRVYGAEDQVEYVFQYQTNGNWSQLQRLAHIDGDNKTTPGLFGGYLLENNGTTAVIKSRYKNDSCLLIWMSDHFLDGWDTAVLTVRAPDTSVDTFHPHCDQVDPFKVRYCPRAPEEEGVYIVKVFSAIKARFFWEISWQVYVEKTGKWYKGDFSTSMKFQYSQSTNAFAFSDIVNEVFTEEIYGSNCQRCNAVTTRTWSELLTPGGDSFYSLFVSNAPYFISDISGRQLVFTGKVCNGINSYVCYQQQSEGIYILRLGGGLFGRETGFPYTNARWEGCGVNGTDRHQLVFNISDGRCTPVQVYDYGDISTNSTAGFPNRCRKPDISYYHEDVFGEAYSKGDMGYRRLEQDVQQAMVDERFNETPFHSSMFVP